MIRLKTILTAFIVLASTFAAPTLFAETPLKPFKIKYAVKYAVASGELTLAMTKGDSNGYNLDSKLVGKGIAKLVIADPVSQRASFVITDNGVQATSYALSDGTDENTKGGRIEYDWDASQASLYSKEDGNSVLPLTSGTMDNLVMQIAAAFEAKLGNKEFSFLELEPGKELQTQNFKYEGTEKIKTKIGEVQTIKYSQNREGSSRTNYIWYSTEHDYVPIELLRVKDGKTEFTWKLISLEQ